MDASPHCTGSSRPGSLDPVWLCVLVAAVLLVHGYHPWAEDGGLYVAGVEYLLEPSLFPKETAFVTEPFRYSLFAPFLANLVRLTHVSLPVALLGMYCLSAWLTLYAALRCARQLFSSRTAQWIAVGTFGAAWTLPVAGTSLLLMDPYVTARSFSTPFSLLAVAAALEPWRKVPSGGRWRPFASTTSSLWLSGTALAAAAAFHPLMGAYAFVTILLLLLQQAPYRKLTQASLAFTLFGVAACAQWFAPAGTPAATAAALSRSYWFLAEWRWYEWLGILGPGVVFAALLRHSLVAGSARVQQLCRASLSTGAVSVLVEVSFAHQRFASHAVARYQPLRAFLLLYALMILLLGGAAAFAGARLASRRSRRTASRMFPALPVACVAALAGGMGLVQRHTFPASPHVEWPSHSNANPWVQAFLWARQNTTRDALFAMDAHYIEAGGEDAQTFRAIAQRSAIPDFSKDGGEAAIETSLAPEWQRAAKATQDLNTQPDTRRDRVLLSMGVQWLVLNVQSSIRHPCPYHNRTVKVCRLVQ